MNRARTFFYVSAGVFLLALSYHLGARNVQAQAGSMVSGITVYGQAASSLAECYVMTPNGDLYYRLVSTQPGLTSNLILLGNFWDGTTGTKSETWGQLKARYRGDPGARK